MCWATEASSASLRMGPNSSAISLLLRHPQMGIVLRCLPTTLVAMIISVLIASAFIGLLLVLLVQGKWTSQDSWFVAVLASAVMAMVIGHYVNQHLLVFE